MLDEIQRAPHLLGYLQGIVALSGMVGQHVLTGSHQLGITIFHNPIISW